MCQFTATVEFALLSLSLESLVQERKID